MRYLAVTIMTICAGLAFAKSASAGYSGPYLCWTSTIGATNCIGLPTQYSLQGVQRPLESNKVSFKLTRHLIDRVLPQYVSTTGMYPGHQAVIYAPGYGTRAGY